MLDYRHFLKMTDKNGILQFSRLNNPDISSGYTLDDNARALMVALTMANGHDLALKYARWMSTAQRNGGKWSNLQINGQFIHQYDSEDSIGRALLACAMGTQSQWEEVKKLCAEMLSTNLYKCLKFTSPRAIAYTLLGLSKYNDSIIHPHTESIIIHLQENLISIYRFNKRKHWHWFENYITYCNGIMPQSLFAAYTATGDRKSLKIAHDSIEFLSDILFKHGYLNIIGNRGWYNKGKSRPYYDQQPIDAASTAYAFYEAYQVIGETGYLELAVLAHQWYRGKNINRQTLYDPANGACYDGLTEQGVNLNQGAEAILSLLLTDTLMLQFVEQKISIDRTS